MQSATQQAQEGRVCDQMAGRDKDLNDKFIHSVNSTIQQRIFDVMLTAKNEEIQLALDCACSDEDAEEAPKDCIHDEDLNGHLC